jgi:hypothetical protein
VPRALAQPLTFRLTEKRHERDERLAHRGSRVDGLLRRNELNPTHAKVFEQI